MYALNEVENLSSAFNCRSIHWKIKIKKRLDRFKKLHEKDVRESMHIYFNFKEILETENMLNSDRFIFVEMKIEKTINTFLS